MSKTDPRIAPKEMIVTRFKSAQQKRQLRDKDRSMTKVTQLLKSPPQKKGKKKQQKSPRKEKKGEQKDGSLVVSDEEESTEYYPEKQKRVIGKKKDFLKPKHEMRMVARTNKRKFCTPKKGIKSPPLTASPWSEPEAGAESAEDSLGEEGLLEILTCPSPVWWEPLPQSREEPIGYRDEEDFFLQTQTETCKQKKRPRKRTSRKSEVSTTEDIEDFKIDADSFTNDTLKITEKRDERFKKKRNKLENVLGNIKNMAAGKDTVKTIADDKNDTIVNDFKGTENVQPLGCKIIDNVNSCNNTGIVKDCKITDNDKLLEKDVSIEQVHKSNEIQCKEEIDAIKTIKLERNSTKVKKLSESTEEDLADLSFRDDEMLLDLENMQIPIEEVERPPSTDSVIILNDDPSSKIINIDDDIDFSIENHSENDSKFSKSLVLEDNESTKNVDAVDSKVLDVNNIDNSNTQENRVNNNTAIDFDPKMNIKTDSQESETAKTNTIDNKLNIKLLEVPKNLPPLKKRPKFENSTHQSPVSYKSLTDDTTESSSISSHEISDTISDTNVKFIMDDEEDVSDKETSAKDEIKEEKDIKDVLKNSKDSKDSYITVYRIMPNENNDKTRVNKFKTVPEYSNYVENLKQIEKQDVSKDDLNRGQLNSFYKKCKNVNRKRCKRSESEFFDPKLDKNDPKLDKNDPKLDKNEPNSSLCESCEPKKSITVAQDENVKYCLKCSSIFDTEECSYCLKSAKDSSKTVKCEFCDFQGDSSSIKTHMLEHK